MAPVSLLFLHSIVGKWHNIYCITKLHTIATTSNWRLRHINKSNTLGLAMSQHSHPLGNLSLVLLKYWLLLTLTWSSLQIPSTRLGQGGAQEIGQNIQQKLQLPVGSKHILAINTYAKVSEKRKWSLYSAWSSDHLECFNLNKENKIPVTNNSDPIKHILESPLSLPRLRNTQTLL